MKRVIHRALMTLGAAAAIGSAAEGMSSAADVATAVVQGCRDVAGNPTITDGRQFIDQTTNVLFECQQATWVPLGTVTPSPRATSPTAIPTEPSSATPTAPPTATVGSPAPPDDDGATTERRRIVALVMLAVVAAAALAGAGAFFVRLGSGSFISMDGRRYVDTASQGFALPWRRIKISEILGELFGNVAQADGFVRVGPRGVRLYPGVSPLTVNGSAVPNSRLLVDGDVVRVGTHQFKFVMEA